MPSALRQQLTDLLSERRRRNRRRRVERYWRRRRQREARLRAAQARQGR